MTALTTRAALAEHEPVVGAMYLPGRGPRGSIVGCSCLNARDYAAAGHKAGWNGWLSHLFASGAVIDAATLADDEAAEAAFWREQEAGNTMRDRGGYFHAGFIAGFRALAAALTERAS